ncbi:hypothetical protein AURDEDRAFT_114111 [Auricularia subglabra TFB-10046 SS5]|nr:hypothetical protein AURDEDRAFT_114111 [Auricularia subglabra TFB-10046 SS5]
MDWLVYVALDVCSSRLQSGMQAGRRYFTDWDDNVRVENEHARLGRYDDACRKWPRMKGAFNIDNITTVNVCLGPGIAENDPDAGLGFRLRACQDFLLLG